MSFDIRDDCRYLESHEWARQENGTVRVGITDFAQDELGDLVFVELPEVGASFDQEDAFGVIESIKAVSDVYTPVAGTVTAVNETLPQQPELVNEDPYGEGWMIEIEPADDDPLAGLLSPEKYSQQIE